MKIVKTLLAVLALAAIAFTGCSNPAGDSGDDGNNNGGNIDVNRSIEVTDAEGTMIGYLVDSGASYLTIMTPSGYIARLRWDGSPVDWDEIYFTGPGLTGDAYLYDYGDIYADDLYSVNYLFTDESHFYQIIHSDGEYAVLPEQAEIDIQSCNSSNVSVPMTIPATSYHFPLERCTVPEVVLLETLTGPLTLSVSE